MILSRVIYELFDWEAKLLAENPDPLSTELRLQLQLGLEDGNTIFVTWTWGDDGGDYHIGFATTSFCTGEPDTVVNASASQLWSELIGRRIKLAYRDESTKQILEVRAGTSRVFCCAFGGASDRRDWNMDVLTVCKQLPK